IGVINFASRQQPTCVRVSLEGSVRNAQASSLETRRTKCAAPQSLTQKETNEIKLSHLAPSCPVLCWASTPLLQRQQKAVDGRDKPGNDGEDTAQRTPSANTNPPSTRKEFKSFRCFPQKEYQPCKQNRIVFAKKPRAETTESFPRQTRDRPHAGLPARREGRAHLVAGAR